MAEEEVMVELEAVQAVYGDDCQVIQPYPPHLHVHLKPRTADVSSQQFVEATIGMRAGPQYPEELPEIIVIDSKGLDDQRQKHLIASIHEKALELASCLMLVALCEEAVERLSSMNHPDGDCPLCLYPLVDDEAGNSTTPFMKLMSCFHCFHCDCIFRWWNWTQLQSNKENNSSSSSTPLRTMLDQQGMWKMMEDGTGKCPVCRKVFLTKDIEHVLDLVGTGGQLESYEIEIDEDLLHSNSEKIRREKFEAILNLQKENSGLIEPKKNAVLLPGMFLPHPVASPSTEPDAVENESQNKNPGPKSDTKPGSSRSKPGARKHNNSNTRRHRTQNSSKQVSQWVRKPNVPEN